MQRQRAAQLAQEQEAQRQHEQLLREQGRAGRWQVGPGGTGLSERVRKSHRTTVWLRCAVRIAASFLHA